MFVLVQTLFIPSNGTSKWLNTRITNRCTTMKPHMVTLGTARSNVLIYSPEWLCLLPSLRNTFSYSFYSLKGFAVTVERRLTAASGLIQDLNNPNFFQRIPVNSPPNESYLPQSPHASLYDHTMEKETEPSDWPDLHVHPWSWRKDEPQMTQKLRVKGNVLIK